MFWKLRNKKPKLQVYLRSTDRQDSDLSRVASSLRAQFGEGPDDIAGGILGIFERAAMVEEEVSGETGLHFNIDDSTWLLVAKSDAEELGCEYEFIDLGTGSLMDLDERTHVCIIDKREIDGFERNLRAPCLRVKNAVLTLEMGTGVDIKRFYRDNAR